MSDEVREMLDSTNFQFKDVDEDGNEIEMTLSEAMESLNNTNWELAKENKNLQQRIDKSYKKAQLIKDIGFDYDGYNDTENLKKIIDELVNLADDIQIILRGDE